MNRREFVGTLSAGAAALALSGASLELEGCNTTWVQTALNDLPVIINIATTVATIVADALSGGVIPAEIASVIQAAAQAAQAALTVIQQLIAQYQANPSATIIQKIQAALQTVQTNLQAILNAAHITNPALQATIAGIIGLALSVVVAIESILPTSGPTPAKTVSVNAPSVPSAGQIRSQANAILAQTGYSKYALK